MKPLLLYYIIQNTEKFDATFRKRKESAMPNYQKTKLACYAGISKSTVLNLFRKYLHITPIHYLIHYRLKEAALLLVKTEKKIATISDETGFHNVDYFCRLFKKHYCLTPTQYRKKKALF